MRQEDLLVEVRDKTLTRVGAIPSDLLTMEAADTHNNVGTWKLSLNAEHPLAPVLSTPGAGIIVTGPVGVLFSGPVTSADSSTTATDPLGTLTVEGVDDTIILSDMLAWPDPAQGDVTKQSKATDDRTGPAETLMHAYVNANVGPGAPANRRRAGLIMGADGARGASVSKSARFEQLGELCKALADPAGLGFRVIQRGANLVFETYAVADRTKDARLGVSNNTLAGQRVNVSTPQKTQVIVGGDGDGANRPFVGVNNTASTQAEADWGRRIENFVDERSTTDTAELTQKGTEALADGGATVQAAQAVPLEDSALDFGRDWFLGDRVSVIVGNTEMAAIVTGMVLKVDSDGYRLGATLGDPTPLDPAAADAKAARALDSRVSSLERTAEAVPPGPRVLTSTGLTQASIPDAYPEGESVLYLSSGDATAGGWDFAGKFGFVTTRRHASGEAFQTWSRTHGSTTNREDWIRGGNRASGWAPWRQIDYKAILGTANYTNATPPTAYPYEDSRLYLDTAAATAGGWPFASLQMGGYVWSTATSTGYVTQRWSSTGGPTQPHEEWVRHGSPTSGWGAWRRLAYEDNSPRGILAIQPALVASAHVGDTEAILYSQTFTASAGRCYKVNFRMATVDTDGTGDNSNTNIRYAKQGGYTSCRWAAGSAVSTSSALLGVMYTTTFDDDSTSGIGVTADFYLNNPPAGPITIGIGLKTLRPAATYGQVRYLPSGGSHLAVEDVGATV
ncbi:siphovirus ReqiPepy6 Gp37-like family protein [Streptomyces sp. NPDC001822]|uniref:siphovirus ReqiPepy6 Gp37-like family protein n=1 Tax=Streptomyces sp. NPDC001822 TaxID=3364614 RepID=UPI0036840620